MNQLQNPVRATHRATNRRRLRYQTNRHPVTTNSTPIRVGGQIVGRVTGDEFIKSVHKSIHFHRNRQSWCFTISSLEDALQAGAKSVVLREQEHNQIYRAPLTSIYKNGVLFNEGYGEQIALPLKFWSQGDEAVDEQMNLLVVSND